MDTGANRFIVNDKSCLTDFQSARGGIKGVGGLPTAICGIGKLMLPLPGSKRDRTISFQHRSAPNAVYGNEGSWLEA